MHIIRRVPLWGWGIALLLVITVAAAITIPAVLQHNREQGFLNALDRDGSTSVGKLPDEQLLVSMRVNCDKIADGWTIEQEVAAAQTNWAAVQGSSRVTEAEYMANVRALFTAAEAFC